MKKYTILEWLLCVLMVALVVVVFAQVLLRYLTYQPLAWTEEAARFVFVWLCLLGAAAATRRGGHFAVDYVPRKLPPGYRHGVIALIHLSETAFYAIITYAGYSIVQVAQIQVAPTLRISMGIPYAAILVGGLLMTLYGLRDVVKALAWRRKPRAGG